MIWNAFLLALRELRRNVLRSFLTILGIVIGVAAVIVMVTLGSGATVQVSQQIASLVSNVVMLIPGQMGPGRGATVAPFRDDAAPPSRVRCSPWRRRAKGRLDLPALPVVQRQRPQARCEAASTADRSA